MTDFDRHQRQLEDSASEVGVGGLVDATRRDNGKRGTWRALYFEGSDLMMQEIQALAIEKRKISELVVLRVLRRGWK